MSCRHDVSGDVGVTENEIYGLLRKILVNTFPSQTLPCSAVVVMVKQICILRTTSEGLPGASTNNAVSLAFRIASWFGPSP